MQSKAEFNNELFTYAANVVKNNITCRDVGQWLETHPYSMERFFMALTLIKHGTLEYENYQAVVEEFKIKHHLEIQQAYSPKFGFAHKSQEASSLYQTLVKLLDSNETTEKLIFSWDGSCGGAAKLNP